MSSSQAKLRENRKSKTSILYELRYNQEEHVEFGQSMNIISLKTPVRTPKPAPCDNTLTLAQKPYIRRPHQSAKLSIKLGANGLLLDDDKKPGSANLEQGPKHVDIGDMVDRFQKRNLITIDRNKITADVHSFTNICGQFVGKIDDLSFQNAELNNRLRKFEAYFKQLKAREPSGSQNSVLEDIGCPRVDKNAQLKILNLERKVETLNYIIKNYRANNKQEVREFEKKVNEYRPNIEGQLTEMLADANKRIGEMGELIKYYEREFGTGTATWSEMVRALQQKDDSLSELAQKMDQIVLENNQLRQESLLGQSYRQQCERLNSQLMTLSAEIGEMTQKYHSTVKQQNEKQHQLCELMSSHEQLTYKYQALQPLETKIKEKDEWIRRNSLALTRIQNQNYVLKTKLGASVRGDHQEIFNGDTEKVQGIEKCSTAVEEMASRFSQELEALPQVNKQTAGFLMHLYDKTRDCLQKVLQEYKQKLDQLFLENKELRNRIALMVSAKKARQDYEEALLAELEQMQAKRKRCSDSQARIETNPQCPSCINWLSHWGQLSSLYSRTLQLASKLSQMD